MAQVSHTLSQPKGYIIITYLGLMPLDFLPSKHASYGSAIHSLMLPCFLFVPCDRFMVCSLLTSSDPVENKQDFHWWGWLSIIWAFYKLLRSTAIVLWPWALEKLSWSSLFYHWKTIAGVFKGNCCGQEDLDIKELSCLFVWHLFCSLKNTTCHYTWWEKNCVHYGSICPGQLSCLSL